MDQTLLDATIDLMPFPRLVTYFVRYSDGYDEGTQVRQAQRQSAKRKRAGGDFESPGEGTEFLLWTSVLRGIMPKAGDKIRDDEGIDWIVQPEVERILGDRVYRVPVTRAAVDDGE